MHDLTLGHHTPMVFSNPPRHWITAVVGVLGVFLFMWGYHDWWRAKPYSLATANEALALAAYAGLALALAAGPGQRLLGWSASAATPRRAFALVGAVAAAGHLTISLVAVPGLTWVGTHLLSTGLAVVATGILASLVWTSFPSLPRWRSNRGVVRHLHLLAAPAFALVTLHVLVLGKAPKWIDWWYQSQLPMPPGTLPMLILGLTVLGLRLIESQGKPRLRMLSNALSFALVVAGLGLTLVPAAAKPVQETPAVVVLCGSSMRTPVEQIVAIARDHGVQVRLDFGGSETILPRILAGERADVAILHDPFPDQLAAAGRLRSRQDLGMLEPVLITAPGNPHHLTGLRDLARPGLRLGLPDARYSTCGAYVRARLASDGILEAVVTQVVVEQRVHQELVTSVRIGAIDAAVVWNFVASPAGDTIQTHRLTGPWPRTIVALCAISDGDAATRLVLAAGGTAAVAAIFASAGFAGSR